jgi:hypothetical protein
MLGMSRSRVSQLLSAGVRPERAFLGTGKLTVAIGTKQEANRRDPGKMLSVEAFAGYELLAEAARAVGLDATYEVVPPPGLVHLNPTQSDRDDEPSPAAVPEPGDGSRSTFCAT